MSTDTYRRRDGRPLSLTAEQRRERAQAAGRASQSLSAYVKRITNRAAELTDQDRAQLVALVLPTDADVYLAGLYAGVDLAVDHLERLSSERAA